MSRGKQSLESWLIEAMMDEDKDGKITAITLMHVVGEYGQEREIHAVRFGGKVWKETELAELFRHKASSYCQDIPGSQLFCLLAFYGQDKEPGARHPFRVNPPTDLGLATEAPTDLGMRQQSMRLTEALVQGAFRERALLMDNVLRSNELLARHNQRLVEEQHVMTENMRSILLAQVQQTHEMKMAELEASQRNALMQKGIELLPALINSLTGRKVVPEEAADTSMIKAIANSLKPEHVKAMAAVLPAEIMGPLSARFAEIIQETEQRKNEGKRRLQLVSGEEDAAGGKKDG